MSEVSGVYQSQTHLTHPTQLHPGMGAATAARRVATSPSGTLRIGRLFHGAKATAVGYSLQERGQCVPLSCC